LRVFTDPEVWFNCQLLDFCCSLTLTSLCAQFTDSVLESYQGPSWRVDLQLFTCATAFSPSPGTFLLSSSATGTCRTCADMDPCPTDLFLREEQDVVTVSLSLIMRACVCMPLVSAQFTFIYIALSSTGEKKQRFNIRQDKKW